MLNIESNDSKKEYTIEEISKKNSLELKKAIAIAIQNAIKCDVVITGKTEDIWTWILGDDIDQKNVIPNNKQKP